MKRAEYMAMKLFRGQIHSHTSLSDGLGFPNDAYEHVKLHTDLDFYGVTEHEVTFEVSNDNDDLSDYREAYSDEYKIMHEQSNAHNKDHQFVTIPGVEITWYDKAGHMNLYNTPWFPRSHAKGANSNPWIAGGNVMYDLPTVYARIAQDSQAIAQFNHPSAARGGNFFDFKHYNSDIDKHISLFEYRYSSNYPNIFNDFVLALDKGWHVSPTYSGDEHKGNWGNVNPSVTGLWTYELTREGIYDAMRHRRTYASADRHFTLAFSANGYFMGSILPTETRELHIQIVLEDPDPTDHIDRVLIYSNQGQVVKQYSGNDSHLITIEDTLPCQSGDYFFVRVFQKDGDEIVSAPIWIGEVTRGTDFAPEIVIHGYVPDQVQFGEEVVVPVALATDDSGETPSVIVSVYNSKGEVHISDDRFVVEEYGDYFIRYSATDSNGNTRVELKRIAVDRQNLNAEKILNEFVPIVNVGEQEDQVGVNLVTDKVLRTAYVQYKPATSGSWDEAETVAATVSYFEAAYGEAIADSHYRVLAAHEATLTNLHLGRAYQYRYGLSADGPWGKTHTFETAWSADETVMYVLGGTESADQKSNDVERFHQLVEVLQANNANGRLLIHLGNLVDQASHIQSWVDLLEPMFHQRNLITAHVVGESELYTKKKRLGTFTGFFNLPKNGKGSLLETNYCFDYGDVHVAIINSLTDLGEQLTWLEEDLRETTKKWKVVMGHYSYHHGQYSDEPEKTSDQIRLSELFSRVDVHLYIGGQGRMYKRTRIHDGMNTEDIHNGTIFLTTGSGIILQANETGLTVNAYNIQGENIDTFTIEE